MLITVNTLDNFTHFLSLLLIFAFVLAVTYYTTKFIANYQKGKVIGSNIEVMETAQIAPNKYIQLVRIGKQYFAIAVCKDTITLISEVDSEGLEFTENKNKDFSGFRDIMEKAKEKLSKENK